MIRIPLLSLVFLIGCPSGKDSSKDSTKESTPQDSTPTIAGDEDGDGFIGDDCNDGDANIHPGATETCDGVDQDCDGVIDNNPSDGSLFYQDADQDGYGLESVTLTACEQPVGYVAGAEDCDDTSDLIHPGVPEICDGMDQDCNGQIDDNPVEGPNFYADQDADGYGDPSQATLACTAPAGMVSDNTDCDDQNPAVYPTNTEICDGLDNDCNGQTDEAGSAVNWYVDNDGDGYGDVSITQISCAQPPGYVLDGSDCDDSLATINPGATEICDLYGLDEDCDGLSEDADPSVDTSTGTAFYGDNDQDGYGDVTVLQMACAQPAGTSTDNRDCDDSNAAIHPNATETCTDTVDLNCDGSVGYTDNDGDGYAACEECDDSNNAVNPAATEICDTLDNNCDGTVNEAGAVGEITYYADTDSDGYGDASQSLQSCSQPVGYLSNDQDCDDSDSLIHPGAVEYCNTVDDDCDGNIDTQAIDASLWYDDSDQDGYGNSAISQSSCSQPANTSADNSDCDDTQTAIHPNAIEICDAGNVDEDCNTLSDDADANAVGKTTFYQDNDSDNYGDSAISQEACDPPAAFVATDGDCNDNDAAINPAAQEVCDANDIDENCNGIADNADAQAIGLNSYFVDNDNDSYGDPNTLVNSCDPLPGTVTVGGDCNDQDIAINPAAQEICDSGNVDEDCDGSSDDTDNSALGQSLWYQDADQDGYGSSQSVFLCDQPAQTVSNSDDCNDQNTAINPAAPEICDSGNVDEDCDGLSDDTDPSATGQSLWYQDNDHDTYGNPNQFVQRCDQPANTSTDHTDCNDQNVAINPAATEVCDANNVDEDCDGLSDDLDTSVVGRSTYYLDSDHDGYGSSQSTLVCDAPTDYIVSTGDCNDAVAAINPAAQEVCDASNTDEDCDGQSDDADTSAIGQSNFYQDSDSDGYGNLAQLLRFCDQPAQSSTNSTDCNDNNNAISPAAIEICDAGNVDEDCDGLSDDLDSSAAGQSSWYQDQDLDTYGNPQSLLNRCDQPTNYVALGTDCDDNDAGDYPGASEIIGNNDDENCDTFETCYDDDDNDGYLDTSADTRNSSDLDCNDPFEGTNTDPTTDCDDTASTRNPGATEICDAADIDENCNGLADDADSSTSNRQTFYRDNDSDGYGDPNNTFLLCDQPANGTLDNTDCNDNSGLIHPGAQEICDSANTDEDCDNLADDADSSAIGKSSFYVDSDHDSYGTSQTAQFCDQPTGYATQTSDCDDTNLGVNPGATEICRNGINEDCSNSDSCEWSGVNYDTDANTTFVGASLGTGTAPGFLGGTLAGGLYDINNDSYPDLIIGDRTFDSTSNATDVNKGRAYILRGGSTGIVDTIASPYGTMTGLLNGDNLGQNVSFLSDIDNDGDDEMLIGSYKANPSSITDAGTCLLYKGSPTALGDLTTASAFITIRGSAKSEFMGWSVSDGGDLNNDGVSEWVAAGYAPTLAGTSANPDNKGMVLVVPSNLATGTYVSTASSSMTARVLGAATGDRLGSSVLASSDIDGDGSADLMVASAQLSTIYLFTNGISGDVTQASADYTLTGVAMNANSVFEVNSSNVMVDVGDNNNDGYHDLLVGADGYDGTFANMGKAYLVLGSAAYGNGSLGPNGTIDSRATATLPGVLLSDFAGRAVAGGNFDNDAYSDLLIGAPGIDFPSTDVGAAVVLYGPSSGAYVVSASTPLDGTSIFLGQNPSGTFGSAAAVGDWNMDNYDDFIIGAPNYAPSGNKLGAAYLFMGSGE